MNPGILDNLGPLAALAGIWEGDAGVDIAPAPSGARETRYRERLSFDPFGPVTNGPQILHGLRYATIAWPVDEAEPFHEETGYWLWDAERELVMRCFSYNEDTWLAIPGQLEPFHHTDRNDLTRADQGR